MNIKEQLQNYCDELNEVLSLDRDFDTRYLTFFDVVNKMSKEIPGSSLYWSRSIYIANRFDDSRSRTDLIQNSHEYICVVSDDIDEHPGVMVEFRKSDGEILTEYCNKLNNILSSGNKELIKKGVRDIHSKLQNHYYGWSIYWDNRIFNEGGGNGHTCLDMVSENGNEYRCKICIEGGGDDYIGLIVEHKK